MAAVGYTTAMEAAEAAAVMEAAFEAAAVVEASEFPCTDSSRASVKCSADDSVVHVADVIAIMITVIPKDMGMAIVASIESATVGIEAAPAEGIKAEAERAGEWTEAHVGVVICPRIPVPSRAGVRAGIG